VNCIYLKQKVATFITETSLAIREQKVAVVLLFFGQKKLQPVHPLPILPITKK
jgi:hypothetical protein